jgi:hypothetical protein
MAVDAARLGPIAAAAVASMALQSWLAIDHHPGLTL